MRPLLLALACAGPTLAPVEEPPATARMYLDGPVKSGSTLVVQQSVADGVELDLTEPWSPDVELRLDGEPRVEQLGDRLVTTQRYRWLAETGSHQLAPLQGEWRDGLGNTGEVLVPGLLLDVGVSPDVELADIAEPEPVWTMPWGFVGGSALLLGLIGAGVWFAGRVGRPQVQASELVEEPPHVVALRAWDAVRKDPDLDSHQKAVAIAQIFRTYTEAVLDFPASAATTREILDKLGSLRHLPEGNVPRARRLLRATDRVKFAGESGTNELFEELDSDLRAFIAGTRPHTWSGEAS